MSIINKILNEIEKNQEKNPSGQANRDDIALGSAFRSYKEKLFTCLTLIIIISVLVVILALLLFLSHKTHNHNATTIQKPLSIPHQQEKVAAAPATALTKKASPEIPNAVEVPAELSNITIDVKNNKTTVNFVLNHDIYYYVEHGDDLQKLKLILGNTTYAKEPSTNLAHTAIKTLTAHKVNNNTEINLELQPNTQIIGLQIYNQPQTQLQLALLNSAVPAATISKTVVPLTPEQRAEKSYQEALELVNSGKRNAAIEKLYSMIESPLSDAQTYKLLATLLTKANRLNEANRVLITANKNYPNNIQFIQLRAYVLAQAGQASQALQLLTKNPPSTQQNPEYFAFVAVLYQQQGQFMTAAQIYNQLLKIYPDRAQWWLGLGVALESANKQNAAKEAYMKAATLGNLPPDAQNFLNNKLNE